MALTGFVSDAVVMQDVANALKVAALPGYYPGLVGEAHQAAVGIIYSRLVARGYTPAQIAAWDQGAWLERRLSVVETLKLAGAAESIPDAVLKDTKEYTDKGGTLDTVLLTASGVWAAPQDTPGTAASGGPCFDPRTFPIAPPGPMGCDGEGLRW